MKRKILIMLLFQIVFNSYSYDWNIHSYIDSKMKELDARKEQLDPRGIFVGDMIDFIDPITILSSDSIGYNPHSQRLSYTDYNNLKIWVKDNLERVSSSLYFEAYYANFYSTRGVLFPSIPFNEDYVIVPSEILFEDLERRNKDKEQNDSIGEGKAILDYLYSDESLVINPQISQNIYRAIIEKSALIDTLCLDISNFNEKDKTILTRKIFVYYFYSFFQNRPLLKDSNIDILEECWNTFISNPWRNWILHKDRKYYKGSSSLEPVFH